MNETTRTLLQRRSIRSYKPDPIPEDQLQQIVECGLHAPSSRGQQARHLLVLTREAEIRALEAALIRASQKPGFDLYREFVSAPNYSITYGAAPVFAVVSSNPELTRSPEADAALVLDNLFHAAWSLGVGSCWINQLNPVGEEPEVQALLREYGVPEGYRVYGAACFGYPAKPAPQPAPRRPGSWTIRA